MTTVSAMSEAELMEAVRAHVRQLGLRCFHAHDSRRSWGPGFPDLVIAGQWGLIFAECKRQSGRLTPEQRAWGSVLGQAGARWTVWRPADLLDGTIRRQLEAIA